MQTRLPAANGFVDETDADLMIYMSMAEEDPAAAEEAWGEFYRRHVDYLYGVCHWAYDEIIGGETGVGDIVMETFQRAFRSAYLFDPGGIDDLERARRRTRAWLGRIAQRLVQDTLRRRRRMEMVHFEPKLWQQIPEKTEQPATDDAVVQRVREAVTELSEKEQIVVRVAAQWYRPGHDHQRLPNDIVADLTRTLRTTPENLRQIRRRAFRKIRDHLARPEDEDRASVPETE